MNDKLLIPAQEYIFPENWILLPPPPFSKIIFFPQSAVKVSPISRFSTPFPIIFTFSLNKSSYFFPNQTKNHIFSPTNQKIIFLPPPRGRGGKMKNIYPCSRYLPPPRWQVGGLGPWWC